jgi:fucose permease
MKRNPLIVALLFLIFFVISFLTNILGPLVPDIINSFSLSLTLAGFLPFSFFVAYGVMSIPAGMLVERYREKRVMLSAFLIALAGALLFAVLPRFPAALPSLFLIGIGMAMLQVTINPLLRVAGGEEHFAFNSVFAQLVFGLASFLSPMVYSYLVLRLPETLGRGGPFLDILRKVVPVGLPWISLYWIFSLVTLAMVAIIAAVRLPRVELKEEERTGAWAVYRGLFRKKMVLLYFLGIFAYVGTEQGVANWISKFLATYHGVDPQTKGASTVSLFWGLMTAGCLLGLVLLKFIDSRRVLVGFAAAAVVTLSCALFGPGSLAVIAFPMEGFFISVMWSIIFSLALNSLDKHHGSFSGILVTGVIGGALVPLAVGWLGDRLGLRFGMMLLYLTLAYILSIGFWSRPLITNATISLRRKKREAQRP